MKAALGPPRCLFVDVGGVLLSNGWDHLARARAAETFGLDLAELERRHQMVAGTYEQGQDTLDDYLDWVVFHTRRPFTRDRFRRHLFAQSTPDTAMLALVARLKRRHGLKVAVVSNEGRELNAHRIRTFHLDRFVDFFVSSCYVHLRKPDREIYRLALDLVQVPAREVVYLENTPLFVRIAAGLGIRGVLHRDAASTRAALAGLGLD